MAMYNQTYECDSDNDHEKCSRELAKQLGMRIIETIDDGNCFFDTLATYGWAYHNELLEHPHQQLRQDLIDDMLKEERIEKIAPFILVKKGKTITSMIESLRKDKAWNNDMGDLLSQIAADTFKVNIYIYDVDPPEIRRLRANQKDHPGPPIHMLRIDDGHYQLLLPQEDALHVIGSYASAHKKNASKKSKLKTAKKNNNNSKNGNSVNKLSKAFSTVAISNQTHKNHKNHGNHVNHQLLKNRQDLQEYEKITVARLHKVLLSFGISKEEINDSILSLPKKEQKTAYYDYYVNLLS